MTKPEPARVSMTQCSHQSQRLFQGSPQLHSILMMNTWIKPVALASHSLTTSKSLLIYVWLNGSARAKNQRLQVHQVLSLSTIIKPTNVLFPNHRNTNFKRQKHECVVVASGRCFWLNNGPHPPAIKTADNKKKNKTICMWGWSDLRKFE